MPEVLQLRKNLASTLAAQIFALPLLIYYFGQLSIVSVLVNILILWTVSFAMFLGLVAGLAGMVYLPLAKIVAIALWAVLEYQIRIVEWFARIPFAQVAVSVPVAAVFVYYGVLFWKLRGRPAKNLLIFSKENLPR